MSTKNYTYGAKAPDVEAAVSDAIYAAHKYRNALCALELSKRDRHETLLQRLAPDYVAACDLVEGAEAELAEIRELIQKERAKQRTKTPQGVDRERERAAGIKTLLRELRAARKHAKQAAYSDDAVKAAMAESAAQHKSDCATAKKESGLYWPTEATVRGACGSFASGAPPRFARYQGEGQLAVQLQGGLSTTKILEADTRVYIEASDELQRLHADGKAPRSKRRAVCFFRVGSIGREPIFARLPIIFHRPLPTGNVKWAYLERRMQADKVRWKLRLTIDCPDVIDREPTTWCAMHYGWSMEATGLRVAIWQGSDGECGSLVLPTNHLRDYETLDHVRSVRDNNFNEARETFAAWLAAQEALPEWLAEVKPHIAKWRSPSRLAGLHWRWRESRIDGDENIFETIDQWRKKDKMQWQHERRLAVRVIRRRSSMYRTFAKRLSDQYGVLYHAKVSAKELTENSLPEDLERDAIQSHRHAKWAAVAELTRMLEEKFPLHAVAVDSHYLSRQCANCGEIAPKNKRKVQCSGCCKTWLSDDNALANTIARGEVRQKNGALLDLIAAKEDAAKKKADRLAKMQEGGRAARELNRKSLAEAD